MIRNDQTMMNPSTPPRTGIRTGGAARQRIGGDLPYRDDPVSRENGRLLKCKQASTVIEPFLAHNSTRL